MSGTGVEDGLAPEPGHRDRPSLVVPSWPRRVSDWPHSLRAGAIAALAVAGLAARLALADQFGDRLDHALFYPAMLVSVLLLEAWGVVAVFVLAVAALHAPLFGPPVAPLARLSDILGLAIFTVDSVLLLLLARALEPLSRARAAMDALDRIDAEQLGHFVEQAPAAMAMFDRDMRYLAASARWRDDFGLKRDIVGKSHYDLSPEIGEEWKAVHARALAGETVCCARDLFERADGERLWLRWEVRPWLHPRHGIGGVLIFSENISEQVAIRQALEANERRLKAILDSAMEAIVTIDSSGRIVSANAAACEVFGYALRDLLGNSVDMLAPAHAPGDHDRYLAAYLQNRETKVVGRRREIQGQRKDGSVFPLEITVSEAQDNGGPIFVGFMRDLSPIRDERRRVNALRDELAHVSRLNDMGEVVASLAHEVGQPIAAILNFAAAHRRASTGPGAESETIGRIEAQARRAAEILKRLRGFIEKRPETREKEDLAALIEEALRLSPPRSRAQIVFAPMRRFEVRVDRIQIEQVIVNLLQNADEALRHAEAPEIRIALAQSEDGGVSVSVADNGPGVEPEARGRLFSAFYSTKRFGMGVGLSICKSIVEAHGGEIGFRPNAPHGAVFEFTLPAAGVR
jgi:two-component system sensor kinase FixL